MVEAAKYPSWKLGKRLLLPVTMALHSWPHHMVQFHVRAVTAVPQTSNLPAWKKLMLT